MKFGKRHYRPQVDQMDCGVASLAMVFGYYGSYYSLAHLRELAKTTMDGTTALGLVKVAEEIGFETRAIKADMTLFDLPDLTFPFDHKHLNTKERYLTILKINFVFSWITP